MHKLIIIIIIIYLICLAYSSKYKIEPYYDITPYNFHWNIFKCLDVDCLKKKSKECYDWCNNWSELGGRHNCRMRCLDYADIQASQLKFNNYFWNRELPKFKYYALHHRCGDYSSAPYGNPNK